MQYLLSNILFLSNKKYAIIQSMRGPMRKPFDDLTITDDIAKQCTSLYIV